MLKTLTSGVAAMLPEEISLAEVGAILRHLRAQGGEVALLIQHSPFYIENSNNQTRNSFQIKKQVDFQGTRKHQNQKFTFHKKGGRMKKIIFIFATEAAAAVGVFSARNFIIQEWGRPGEVFVWCVLAALLLKICIEIRDYLHERPKTFDANDPKIEKYLCNFIESGGRTAIFTRDLSWAESGNAKATLDRKAKAGGLDLIVGRQADHITDLMQKGAAAHNYSTLGVDPRVRFTLVDFKKVGARLAIGYTESGGKHVIHEFCIRNAVMVQLATDLIELAQHSLPQVDKK